jgi:hypothetical protein
MQYIPQKDPMGCLRASVAMVLDITYEQAASVPLQDTNELRDTGTNKSGALALDRIETLAQSQGKQIVDLDTKPFVCKAGLRYIAVVGTTDPLIAHSVAIDETGIVFDPDTANKNSRKHWSEYEALAMLEFRPL